MVFGTPGADMRSCAHSNSTHKAVRYGRLRLHASIWYRSTVIVWVINHFPPESQETPPRHEVGKATDLPFIYMRRSKLCGLMVDGV